MIDTATHYSLNEIESMGKRAAYGANWYWGIAEEAGKASRWLASHGLPGPELLVEVLLANEGKPYEQLLPRISDNVWRARSGVLCPLLAGSALSDRAAELAAAYAFEFEAIGSPLLLAPYVAMSAKAQKITLELSWKGADLFITPDGGLLLEGDERSINALIAERASCRIARQASETKLPESSGRTVDSEAWAQLEKLAARTFAPSTDTSRMGAGAGLVDND